MKRLIAGSLLTLAFVTVARARMERAPGMHHGPPWARARHDRGTHL